MADLSAFVASRWDDEIVDVLHDYIAIPAKSPSFDPDWEANGHLEAAVELVSGWCRSRPIDGATVDVARLPGRTPLVFVDVPATNGSTDADTVLLYGHLDKQPEMEGWRDSLSPWTPVRDGDRLYGRGGADDGYSAFAALTAIEAVREAGLGHRRCVVLIEASEESASRDLSAHVDALGERLGAVSLVVCLDSGCGTYDRLWTTTSLRGLVNLTLDVRLLTEGIHSGASGAVASSFRVARGLLDRVEDTESGEIRLPELRGAIPPERVVQAEDAAAVLGRAGAAPYPWAGDARPVSDDPAELLLASTWRPALSVVGAGGLPEISDAGNVLRAHTGLRLSFRLAPTVDPARAEAAITSTLTADRPYGAAVTVRDTEAAAGWNAPATEPWLEDALRAASEAAFDQPPAAMGEGGAIPFMAMLGERFPQAQFMVVGVLGPGSNAHGPNEFLHIPMAQGLTACVGHVLAAHAARLA